MGVQGLWTVVQPCARPTNLATLNRKRLAVDASIWIYQFLKAVRDKEGNALRNSHVVGFFRRLCKLLWYGVKPVFVFDGGAPALKRATLQRRRRRREGRREDAARTAGKLLAVQMHRIAEEEEERRQQRAGIADEAEEQEQEQEQEHLPSADQMVYADELGMSKQERMKTRRFHKKDAYHLPELENGIEAMGKPDDPRIMSVEELEEYARQFNNGEDINLYDFSKIDFDGDFFKSLPPADRYNILNAARLRSRLRMGLSKEQLDVMFPNRMDFSKFQIERVKERNKLTQRLMQEMGMTGLDLTLNGGVNRVAGDRNREYILVKNEGAEGGWALGVVSRDKDQGKIHKPIDVDALEFRYQAKDEEQDDEYEDEEFEDVPIEGFNRLPKISSQAAYQQAQDYGSARRQFYNSRQSEDANEDDEALFVNNDNHSGLFGDQDALSADEDEDLNRAIALSLQNDHGISAQEPQGEEVEDFPPPAQWTQKAAETSSKPITAASGSMIAHIVNNRANAAIPKRQDNHVESDSDSDVDLQSALRAARKRQPKPKLVEVAPVRPNVKNLFDGPLPFERLDWRTAFGRAESPPARTEKQAEKPSEKSKQTQTGEFEGISDDEAGGFEREPSVAEVAPSKKDDKPLPLPPWLTDTTDIRESVRRQQELDMQMNAEDEEFAREEELRFRQQHKDAIVEIESSSDDNSDIEILDAPPVIQRPSPKQSEVSPVEQDSPVTVTNELPPKAATEADFTKTPPQDFHITPSEEPQRYHSPDWPEEEDEEMEFEDVTLPTHVEQPMTVVSSIPESEEARMERELFGDPAYQPENQSSVFDDLPMDGGKSLFVEDRDASPEYYEFSDPEEEELLAQMAEEAEEHARFASQLNNKSQQENQEAYEKELRALRTQQKKDRRDADEVTQIMVTECQALLKLFGIPYITAPMEAEAQCAQLVRLGLVDGIVTDDSDTFLFGGTRVYKNMFNSNKFVECYLARDLEEELELSREQLIALAQLLGSDYTEGLPGIGPVTAVEILSEFPGREGLTQFRDWWEEVHSGRRSKEADQTSSFRRKFRRTHFPKLFLPGGFPSPAVFDAYLHPEVDSSPEAFQWGVPDLEGLRQFLMSTIGWSKERTDEVLVPVIRDMNKRDLEGTQANITRYFEGAVGAGASNREAFAPRQRVTGSRRMAEAVVKLKARKKKKGGGLSMELPVAIPVPKEKGTGKGKKRKVKEFVAVDEAGAEDGGEQEEEEHDDEEHDEDVSTRSKGKGKAPARGRGRGKRSKASEQ
ncbi:DNA repair protein rad13 [Cladorrhinum sp. PSN259]|nr:DNA repair protein rad13 [Cladorrhinum sp. PSN259]